MLQRNRDTSCRGGGFRCTGRPSLPCGSRPHVPARCRRTCSCLRGRAVTNLDPIADAIGLLEQSNVAPPYVVVMHPRTWGAIRKLKEQPSGHNKPLVADPPSSDAPQRVFGSDHLRDEPAQRDGDAGLVFERYNE